MAENTIVWYMQVTLDRQVASPGETVHVSFSVSNPLIAPIFIDTITWNTNFYPVEQAVSQQFQKIVPAGGQEHLGAGFINVPDVPDAQYQIDVVARTHFYNPDAQQWVDLGIVPMVAPKYLLVVHTPRYRAFVSRSLRTEDMPVADAMLPIIQSWGFETHTVGINEFEDDPTKISQRVLEEIVKAECVIGIATPRDVGAISNLVYTMAWLNSEASFAFARGKPLLILADQSIKLEGFLASPDLPVGRYDPANLPTFLGMFNTAMPVVRQLVEHHVKTQAVVQAVQAEQVVAYGAFVAGTVVQRKLPGLPS